MGRGCGRVCGEDRTGKRLEGMRGDWHATLVFQKKQKIYTYRYDTASAQREANRASSTCSVHPDVMKCKSIENIIWI